MPKTKTKKRSTGSILKLILCTTFLFAISSSAKKHQAYNAEFFRRAGWKDSWSDAFMHFIEKDGNHLIQATINGFRDGADFCASDIKNRTEAKEFLLAMFKGLSLKESRNNARISGYNSGRIPTGLFQMDYIDAGNNGCRTIDGKKYFVSSRYQKALNAPLKNPYNNIKCAITIANKAAKKRKHKVCLACNYKGRTGVLGIFWQPVRKGNGGNGRGGTINNNKTRNHIRAMACGQQGIKYTGDPARWKLAINDRDRKYSRIHENKIYNESVKKWVNADSLGGLAGLAALILQYFQNDKTAVPSGLNWPAGYTNPYAPQSYIPGVNGVGTPAVRQKTFNNEAGPIVNGN